MDLIVGHNNADFDAFSSLVAAKKIYPNSKLLLPGSHERSVREFLSLVKDKIKIEKERTCDLSDVKRLVIVDTRHKSRIGIAAKLLDDPSVEVHIYDHHPRTPHDIKPDKDIFQEVGATVSILIDILRKRKSVKVTPLEATIMLLGIYEETGSLTYRTTTKLDVDTVSFLLSRGANLSAISSYLNRELTPEELTFLTALISSTKVVIVNGINVAVATGTIKRFIGELGAIVRKLQDVENFPVLFVLFKIGDSIRVIARSRLKEVDVNKILKRFGGGGHRSAASAKVGREDADNFEEKLLNALRSQIKVKIFARDIMDFPVKVIADDKKIIEAKKILERLHLKGAPVVKKNKLVGIITLGDIKKAILRRYGHAPVKGYMSRALVTIKPDTPLHMIQKIMFEKNIGRLPVMKNKKLTGIVTRTSVLKSVHRDIFKKHTYFKKKQARLNISTKMKQVLPKQILEMLHVIGKNADCEGLRAFVVGGFVRDMLLGVKNLDVDIAVEGDAISFGRHLARIFGGSLVVYKKFGTSSIVIDWPKGLRKSPGSGPKFKIDFAAARKESYEKPAALPTVRFSSLKNDLQRRDFTINAMAASLNKQSFGQLIDFFGGEKDLENKVIRVLHDGSFIDDPTRIFRAVRFEQRFGFRIDKYTEDLIKTAIREGMFSRTQNHRIRDEVILMLKEPEPMKAISRMKELHELRFIHKKIFVRKSTAVLFMKIKNTFSWYTKSVFRRRHVDLWVMYLAALLDKLDFTETKSVCDKFAFRRSVRIRLLSCKKRCEKILRPLSSKKLSASGVYSILEPLSFEEILFIRSKAKSRLTVKRITDFFAEYNKVKIKIGGHDLKKLGLKPGPVYKKILDEILHKKIDGDIKTKKDELMYVKKML
ncbi:MAG: CBS domain-containing protein [Candidatus Omnitrophica bacterium]|nr:CBS domain-containing protein [Candidatus Omnitrophota bacterium]